MSVVEFLRLGANRTASPITALPNGLVNVLEFFRLKLPVLTGSLVSTFRSLSILDCPNELLLVLCASLGGDLLLADAEEENEVLRDSEKVDPDAGGLWVDSL